jgi:hypothetical protein
VFVVVAASTIAVRKGKSANNASQDIIQVYNDLDDLEKVVAGSV